MESNQENDGKESSRPGVSRKFQSGNLILVGMMGSGKTTMGRALAKHLGKVFIDSDEEIIKRTGVTIPHIFDIEGEAGFRQRESASIRELVRRDNTVLATGGGVVIDEQNRELLQQNGIVIYLKASVHDLWYRTRHDRNRPLLQTGNPHAKLTELYQLRDPLYRQMSDIVVQSGRQNAHTLMLHVADEIEAYRSRCDQATL
ncbi:MAG TPA: shikimate kinase [Gallionella sp.]|nr:shikimate kinase [Gallionella sp.]